jgi:hypothetical protein
MLDEALNGILVVIQTTRLAAARGEGFMLRYFLDAVE